MPDRLAGLKVVPGALATNFILLIEAEQARRHRCPDDYQESWPVMPLTKLLYRVADIGTIRHHCWIVHCEGTISGPFPTCYAASAWAAAEAWAANGMGFSATVHVGPRSVQHRTLERFLDGQRQHH